MAQACTQCTHIKAQGSDLDAGWCGSARQNLEHHWKAADAADMSVKKGANELAVMKENCQSCPKQPLISLSQVKLMVREDRRQALF